MLSTYRHALLGLLLGLLSWRPLARADEDLVHYALSNGLKVLLAPDPDASQVCVLVRYAVGYRDDPAGYRGLAHLTEHMTYRAGRVIAQLEDLGATEYQGVTGADETYYYALVPTSALGTLLWLEARRMAFAPAEMVEEAFELEQKVVLREWSENWDNAGGELREGLWKLLYPSGHPYRLPSDRPSDVRAVRLPNVQWFTQSQYRPDNAVLVVAGRFDVAQTKASVERYFGTVQPTGGGRRRRDAVPMAPGTPPQLRMRKEVSHETLTLAWQVPGRDSEPLQPLRLFAELLSVRLTDELVERAGPASSATAALLERELDSIFMVEVIAREDHKAEMLLGSVDRTLAELREGIVDAAQLDHARRVAERAATQEDAHLERRALRLARRSRASHPGDTRSYDDIAPSALQHVAQFWLPARRRVVGMVEKETP